MERRTLHELTPAYALAALAPEEEAAYETHLAHCGRCRVELAAFEETAASLAYAVAPVQPDAALRERIVAQARAERANVVPLARRALVPALGTVAAAAAVAAIVLGLWARSLSSELAEERAASATRDRALAVLAKRGSSRYPVGGPLGTLVVTPGGTGALVLFGLEDPGEKLYEAWVSSDGETMLPAGTFWPSGRETVVLLTRPVPTGGLVAVTLEDHEVEQPSRDPLFVVEAT